MELSGIIREYIRSKNGTYRVYPVKESIFVYYLEQEQFELKTYTFHDKIKANIYDDLYIDMENLDI